jgi:para-aminobenzoate synthetase component 1
MQNLTPTYKTTVIDIPPETEISAIFQHYSEKNWSMLLDSGDSQHANNCYDIMVAEPIASLTFKDGNLQIAHTKPCDFSISTEQPITALKQLLYFYFNIDQADRNVKLESPLPFIAGAMGYFGYDLGRAFERLPDSNENDLSCPDMAIGIYSWSVIKNKQNGKYFLCWIEGFPAPTVDTIISLAVKQSNHKKPFELLSDWQSNMSELDYHRKIAQVARYLRAGDCYQVNLAQRFSSTFAGDPWLAFQRLREANQAPFSAFIRIKDSVVLSLSPERFLSVKQGNVETTPIKGTRPRHLEKIKDEQSKSALVNSEKDRAENLMIVDLLRNDISKNCTPGTVNVPDLFYLESFPAVHHLVSKIKAKLASQSSPLDLLRDAFPGGSITGAPKIRAMEIIDELEPNRRGVYCGSIGYIGLANDMDTSICIRTLLCEKNQIHCWAGGGIVLDSEASSEYQECLDKVAKILPVLTKKT